MGLVLGAGLELLKVTQNLHLQLGVQFSTPSWDCPLPPPCAPLAPSSPLPEKLLGLEFAGYPRIQGALVLKVTSARQEVLDVELEDEQGRPCCKASLSLC